MDYVATKLNDRGFDCDGLHGDITQTQREKILGRFKKRKTNVLVATDVAARGLDIDDLTHVINYALPQDPEAYLHRIGRTGRAGREGTAVTFVTPDEYRKLMFIKNTTQTEIRKERVPRVIDVIKFKREKIAFELNNLITEGVTDDYLQLARTLLGSNHPDQIIGALIKYSFQKELEEHNYGEIQDLFERKRNDSSSREKSGKKKRDSEKPGRGMLKGKDRLFFAMGKRDQLSPKKLLSMLQSKAKVESNKVDDIQIFDTYSFLTVPTKETRYILEKFNKDRGKRPLVEIAKK